ncbi:MAG: hypothetical protein ACR5K4_00135 [Sodalis sp. (in: enterobacteria)]
MTLNHDEFQFIDNLLLYLQETKLAYQLEPQQTINLWIIYDYHIHYFICHTINMDNNHVFVYCLR